MATRYPVAYVRRSQADATDTGDVSREAQEAAVRDLAHRDGHNGDLVTYTDWSKSASEEKSGKRTQYAAMVARIEAGEVSDVYAYALDRLNRSLILSARFVRACEDNDVRIVTHREGEVRQDTPAEWLRWTILATFGEYELRTIKTRSATARAVRRERGDHIGRVGYGYQLVRNEAGAIVAVPDPTRPLEPIVDAVREAGSILGGAKLLQVRGIPAPDGGKVWGSTTLRRVIERAAPELLPKVGPTGRRQPSRSSAFSQLLMCHCGRVLTPEPTRRAYRCRMGIRLGSEAHGPAWIGEAALMPWVQAEAARFRVPSDAVALDTANESDREKLGAKRARVIESFIDGVIDKAERDRRLARIDAELDVIVDIPTMIQVPQTIDWTWRPEHINTVLRTYWNAVELGPDLRPIRADRRIPDEYWA